MSKFCKTTFALAISCMLAACTLTQPVQPPLQAVLPVQEKYTVATWSDLPNWADSRLQEGFNAWKSGCVRLKNNPVWGSVCAQASTITNDTPSIRNFLESSLIPLQLKNPDGSTDGLITGYYEPVYQGSLTRTDTARYPLYGQPKDLITVALDEVYPELKGKRLRGKLVGQKLVPYPDRAAISKKGVDAPVLAWLNDPLDVQFMQVQGSGRVKLENGEELRLGYADQNGRPYVPIGRWLVQQGEIAASDVTMQSIRAWAAANPKRTDNLLDSNPSYVFFRTLPASNAGPIGSLGIPLTAEYSIAVDPTTIAQGSLVFIATTRPDNAQVLNRLVAAQDTGGAIRGQVRADYFWGTGNDAGELAGKMKQSGKLWLLWPKSAPLP